MSDAATAELPTRTEAVIGLVRRQARIIGRTVELNLEGLTHEESLLAPTEGGNCANWILGHMLLSYQHALPHLRRDPVVTENALDRYRRGSPALSDPAGAVPFDELRKAWRESTARVEDGLQGLTWKDLARRSNFFGGKSELSLTEFLDFVMFHQAYHAGQLAILRRFAGKEGAIP